jgi:hypothetical protein
MQVWSRDAGTYYCNEVFFRTLWAVRGPRAATTSAAATTAWWPLVPVIFIHLPGASSSSGEFGRFASVSGRRRHSFVTPSRTDVRLLSHIA